MAFINPGHRKKYFSQFKAILVNRHRQNYAAYQQQGHVVADNTARSFGRYLRAARVNGALSQQDLAQRCGLSHATITALEQGLIVSGDIKPQWLQQLSLVLNEDVTHLNLLLQRSPGEAVMQVTDDQWVISIKAQKAFLAALYSKINLPARPMYAALCSTMVLFIAASTLFFVGNIYHKEVSPSYKPKTTLINVNPLVRLNMVQAEIQLETYPQDVSSSLPYKLLLLENQDSPIEFSANVQFNQPF